MHTLLINVTWNYDLKKHMMNAEKIFDLNEMNGVLGHDFALVMLYWAGDNLG